MFDAGNYSGRTFQPFGGKSNPEPRDESRVSSSDFSEWFKCFNLVLMSSRSISVRTPGILQSYA